MTNEERQAIRHWTVCAQIVIAILLFVACCAPHAFATDYTIRYQHPGGTTAYEAIDVCASAGCTSYAAPCAPGATCSRVVNLPSGENEGLWLVASAGEWRSPESNRRTVVVPAPEGCAWDADDSGWVTPLDFAAFLRRFTAGEVNLVDFAAFLRVFGRSCS